MLRLGTRGSRLARTQAASVGAAVTRLTGMESDLVVIRSEGDDVTRPLDEMVRPGAFVATLRDALLAGRVDFVVHSYKDLPSAPVDGLVVAAVPERAACFDVLVTRDGLALADLPHRSRIGTSSPRRAAALRRLRADLEIVPVRGNIDTRLGKIRTGEVDAVVLAAAALERLGQEDVATQLLGPPDLLPAPAQGALAVECRSDSGLVPWLSLLDHTPSRVEVVAERAVLEGVEATCTTAVGALARYGPGQLELRADLSAHRGVDYASGFAAIALAGPDLATDPDLAAARELGLQVAGDLVGG